MRDSEVLMSGYRCRVVDPPCPKTKDNGAGGQVVVTDRNGVTQFVVALFVKRLVGVGERAPKGEEIRVTLETDPGEGFDEGTLVELIHPRVSAYQLETEDGRSISGISFKAAGLKPAQPIPVVSPVTLPSSTARAGDDK
jgi:hypothetical protein